MVRQAGGAPVGQLGKLRPIVNRPTAAIAADSGGSQPPRRLPACPTSRQRFHFNVVHPFGFAFAKCKWHWTESLQHDGCCEVILAGALSDHPCCRTVAAHIMKFNESRYSGPASRCSEIGRA